MSTWIGVFDVKQCIYGKTCIVGNKIKNVFTRTSQTSWGEKNYVKIMGTVI
jgi:hypothetical protein